VAIAEAGRESEIRFREVENQPATIERLIKRLGWSNGGASYVAGTARCLLSSRLVKKSLLTVNRILFGCSRRS
jgi:hypothetical protein